MLQIFITLVLCILVQPSFCDLTDRVDRLEEIQKNYRKSQRGVGPFFQAGALFWKADGEGLAYAVKSSSPSILTSNSSVKNLNFEWDFGFEVMLGYQIPHDLWSFSLDFKFIHNNAEGESTVSGNSALFPIWTKPDPITPFYLEKAHAHWRVHLGILDFLMERKWAISSRWTLSPQFGLRTAWIRQKYNLEYYGSALSPNRNEELRMKNKYWGLGPAFGVCTDWKVFSDWSIFAEGLVSILYGQFYLHQDERTLDRSERFMSIYNSFKSSVCTLDGTIGLRWAKRYSGALKGVSVEAAWDQMALLRQNQLIRFSNETVEGSFIANQGNISLHGFHLGARFDF